MPVRVALWRDCEDDVSSQDDESACKMGATLSEVARMNSKTKFALGVLTALAMLALTYLVPRGGAMRDAQLVQFPVTVGVWAIFVLLFVKLK
jgi:hypothetical protein